MGRMTIKKKADKKVKVSYDQELNDIREWQENQYNPGHYVGTGRLPYPLKSLSRRPKLKLLYLLFFFGPLAASLLFTEINIYKLLAIAAVIALFAWIIHDSKKQLR